MPKAPDGALTARPLAVGANLLGYFDSTVGVGEAARQIAEALDAADVAVSRIMVPHANAPLESRGAGATAPRVLHPATIACVNPEGMVGAQSAAPNAFVDRRVIGLWWWEVMAFPGRWLYAFDTVDEVWVGSRFVADALAMVSPVPVVALPMPVAEPRPAQLSREALGLPDGFLFGFAFDYGSVVERKNPLGLISAFRRAFPPDQRSTERLVLKVLNAERHANAHHVVMKAAAEDSRIHVLDRRLPKAESDALIRELDCYVSLHRSEGFGLTLAEAMLLGTPVIATGYAGPTDFVTPFTGSLVDYRLIAIGAGHDPYPLDGEWADPDIEHAAALMRDVRSNPSRAEERAQRARAEVRRRHAPAVAGRIMADRLAFTLSVPRGAGTRVDALDLSDAERRLRSGPPRRTSNGVARNALREAILRLLRPYSVHQRLMDEELLRAIRMLDQRVRGLASGQSTLVAELVRLRRSAGAEASTLEGLDRSDPDDHLPPRQSHE
jgi:hypothetical protein